MLFIFMYAFVMNKKSQADRQFQSFTNFQTLLLNSKAVICARFGVICDCACEITDETSAYLPGDEGKKKKEKKKLESSKKSPEEMDRTRPPPN